MGTTGINLEMVINNSWSDASSVAGALASRLLPLHSILQVRCCLSVQIAWGTKPKQSRPRPPLVRNYHDESKLSEPEFDKVLLRKHALHFHSGRPYYNIIVKNTEMIWATSQNPTPTIMVDWHKKLKMDAMMLGKTYLTSMKNKSKKVSGTTVVYWADVFFGGMYWCR